MPLRDNVGVKKLKSDKNLPSVDIRIDQTFKRSLQPLLGDVPWDVAFEPKGVLLERVRQVAGAGERPLVPLLVGLDYDDAMALLASLDKIPAELSLLLFTPDAETIPPVERYEIADFIPKRSPAKTKAISLTRAAIHTTRRAEMNRLATMSQAQGAHLRELNEIGAALSSERNLDRLLELIVTKLRGMLSCDAGSLYLIERNENSPEPATLFFKVAQNDTLEGEFKAFRMPINRQSISGYVALTGNILQIPDVYELGSDVEYQFNKAFDQSTGYRSKSQLVVPMINHKDEIIGVVQLINKKKDASTKLKDHGVVAEQVIDFTDEDREMASSVASQAAVAIENAELYESIQRQFESFITASVSAIEQRDPTTAGHSERVATLTVGLATAVNMEFSGPLEDVTFTREQMQEIQYAALLHDFGKIGVKEDVLIKAKKLYPFDLRHIEDRFRLIRKTMELQTARQVIDRFLNVSHDEAIRNMKILHGELEGELRKLETYLAMVREANEPKVLPEAAAGGLKEMIDMLVPDPDGHDIPFLTQEEYINLSIPKGSLNDSERLEIESHVSHTYKFLQLIPWTKDLRGVADIAYGHHEKLDGTGYPRGVKAEKIPVQTRMMTVSDIFDALTATDRPYKRALSVERALDILQMEVKEGKIDGELFRIFCEARVFEMVPAGQNGP